MRTDFVISNGMFRGLLLLGTLALAGQFWSGAAAADEVTQSMDVSLEILPSCTLQTPTVDLQFGTQISYGGAPTTQMIEAQSTELQVNCSLDYDWHGNVDTGQNALGAQLRMFNPATNSYIPYNLYFGAPGGHFWQPTTGPIAGTGTGTIDRFVFRGEIPASTQLGAAGLYSDRVTVTFSF